MAEAKKVPDWERIEGDYRAGVLSLREIATKDGNVTEGAIRKRAKRDGWTRDLKAKIDAKAEDLVRRQAVRNDGTHENGCAPSAIDKATEREIIDANAHQIARVRSEHRTDISRSRSLVLTLLGELEGQTASNEMLVELGQMMRRESESGVDRLNDTYNKIISSAGRIDSVKKLTEALKNLIGLEREAYGLDQPDKPADDPRDLSDADLEQRLRDLESRHRPS
jgi:uncharacterized membrane protein YheB (UPF0754 family)